MKDIASMTSAVRKVIDVTPSGTQFHGNELKAQVVKIYPDAAGMYVDTIMRMMRRKCRTQVKCVDHNKSLYEKV